MAVGPFSDIQWSWENEHIAWSLVFRLIRSSQVLIVKLALEKPKTSVPSCIKLEGFFTHGHTL